MYRLNHWMYIIKQLNNNNERQNNKEGFLSLFSKNENNFYKIVFVEIQIPFCPIREGKIYCPEAPNDWVN